MDQDFRVPADQIYRWAPLRISETKGSIACTRVF